MGKKEEMEKMEEKGEEKNGVEEATRTVLIAVLMIELSVVEAIILYFNFIFLMNAMQQTWQSHPNTIMCTSPVSTLQFLTILIFKTRVTRKCQFQIMNSWFASTISTI